MHMHVEMPMLMLHIIVFEKSRLLLTFDDTALKV